MRGVGVVATAFMLTLSTAAFAQLNCDPLKPTPPQNISLEVTGRIDTTLQKFVSLGGTIEGTYREAAIDVLKDYPDAGRLFLWSRMLYLYCENIRSSSLTDSEKLSALNSIALRIDSPPPQQGEYLLDPPILQFGMTTPQVRTMLAARNPRGFAENNQIIIGLQALFAERAIESTPGHSAHVIQANATLFGLQGEAAYGFDQNDRLSWVSVWNVCARDKHEFSNAPDIDPSYLEWRAHKDIGINDAVDCSQIIGLWDKLRSRFGEPLKSNEDDFAHGLRPSDSLICDDLYQNGLVTCSQQKSSRAVGNYRFIAKDRLTPIDLTVKTLRYSALRNGDRDGMTRIRERKVAILTISSPTGATPLAPVVTGVFYMYLN
jgi:hypothetical protein